MKAALTAVAVGILVAAIAGAGGPNPKPTPSPSPSSSPPPAAAAYSITDLGSLGGGYTVGLAINNNGQVTGYSSIAKTIPTGGCCGNCYGGGHRIPCTTHPTHAFVWSNGTMTDLGTLGGNYSQGLSINLSGQVVGSADTGTGSSSFLWNGTKMTALSGLGAYWINDSGQIAGACTDSTGSYPCVDSNGKFTRLPQPSNPAVSCGVASAVNNNGQAIGTCDDTSSNEHAVLWQNGTATDLGDNFISAAVNDNDVVVWSDLIYSGGTVQNLNNLIPAGSPQIDYAVAINDKGQIVANAGGHALLLTPN